MKKLDVKHTAFHILVGIYFLWVVVITVLIGMTAFNEINYVNTELNEVFLFWILLNLFMGTVIFTVIRMFKNKTILNRIVLYSYVFVVGASAGVWYLVKA
ncbi:hypothetical protein [Flavobacterium alkalisoli]|uniref:hypothetical protein n=1 Tax=Flavobacterium alkalisoli TaxID=2602769 RepID=UPI003A944534